MARPRNPLAVPARRYRKDGRGKIRYYSSGLAGVGPRVTIPGSWGADEEEDLLRTLEKLNAELTELRAVKTGEVPPSHLLLATALDAFLAHRKSLFAANLVPKGTVLRYESVLKLYVRPLAVEGRTVADLALAVDGAKTIAEQAAHSVDTAVHRKGPKKGQPLAKNSKSCAALTAFGRFLTGQVVCATPDEVPVKWLSTNPWAFLAAQSKERTRAAKAQRYRDAVARINIPGAAASSERTRDNESEEGIGLEDVPTAAHLRALEDAVTRAAARVGEPYRGGPLPLTIEQAKHLGSSVTRRAMTGLRECEALAVHTKKIHLADLEVAVDWQLDRYKLWLPGSEPPLAPVKYNTPRIGRIFPDYLDELAEQMEYADAVSGGWLNAPPRRPVSPKKRSAGCECGWATNWPKAYETAMDQGVQLLETEYQAALAAGLCGDQLPLRWTWTQHFTRHFYGSHALASPGQGGLGWALVVVQKAMGHENEETTLRTYRHAISGERAVARTATLGLPPKLAQPK